MREAHRLAVHECLLPLIFIFTSLVASDVRSSYETKQKNPLFTSCSLKRELFQALKIWTENKCDMFPGSCCLSHTEPILQKNKLQFPCLSKQHLNSRSARTSFRLGLPNWGTREKPQHRTRVIYHKPTKPRWPSRFPAQEAEKHPRPPPHRPGGPCSSAVPSALKDCCREILVTTCP